MPKFSMSRRNFLAGSCAGIVALALGHSVVASRRPNIVLIMADDLGYTDIGCYGSKQIKTPCLDALAEKGLRFTDFHSNGAVCSPTRAALLTGQYQQRHGIDGVVTAKSHRHTGLSLDSITFAEMLKEAGYTTALFGKWHLGYGTEFNPVRQGFDVFKGYVSGNVDYHSHIDQAGYEDWWQSTALENEEGYVTDLISDHAVSFINRHKDNPFCLYLPHEAPHYPLQRRSTPAFRKKGETMVQNLPDDPEQVYIEMIEAMDEGIGCVVQALEDNELTENTLIFFCSDNGPARYGNCVPLRGKKGSLWEGGHRVPAIACWPGHIQPGETDAATITMDLFPTFAQLAGVQTDKLDGVDLGPVLFHDSNLPERMLFWRFGNKAAVRQGPWKLVAEKDKQNKGVFKSAMLFNLDNDLSEQHDLVKDNPKKYKELTEAYWVWEKEVTHKVAMRT